MSRSKISTGECVEIIAEDLNGSTGIVREIHKSRGEPTVYNLEVLGQKGLMSYLETEIIPPTAKRR